MLQHCLAKTMTEPDVRAIYLSGNGKAFCAGQDISELTGDNPVSFEKILSERFKTDEPGATALVARNGQIIYKKAFGMANLELNVPSNLLRLPYCN